MKPDANTSPPDSTLDTRRLAREAAAVAAHQLHLVRLGGERVGAVDQRLAARSCRSACSGGMISSRIVFPDRLVLVQPNMRSAAVFQW